MRIQKELERRLARAATILAFLVACATVVCAAAAHTSEPAVAGHAGVLMELRTGKVFWQRNPDSALAPASTTKILTALIVLDRSRMTDDIKVPTAALKSTGAGARLRAGERLSVEQLLYAMMLASANDAAIALASHAGGSVAGFVSLMNDKARSLGARRSSFRNPTGLPQQGHLTTARDLAVISRAALAHADFRSIVGTRKYPWRSANWRGEVKNSNLFLESYPGAIGVKTGQTREAGFCLVAAAVRGERSLLAVILKSTDKSGWRDAKTLLDHGFRNGAN